MRSSRRASHAWSRAVSTRTRRRREVSTASAAPASRSCSRTGSRPAVRTRRGVPGSPAVVRSSSTRSRRRSTAASPCPGERWVTGEASRRLVHELRPRTDAVAVGMGTVRADAPRLDVRDVPAARQPRRLAFGRGPLPAGSTLELRSGALGDELARARRRRRAVAAARGRADPGNGVPRGRIRRQAARVRGADAVGRRAAVARRPLGAEAVARTLEPAAPTCWRGDLCPRRGVPRRRSHGRLTSPGRGSLSACSPGSCAKWAGSRRLTGGDEGVRLEIEAPLTAPLVDVGGSVAINGVCLTAETVEGDRLVFHAVPETLSRRRSVSSRPGQRQPRAGVACRGGDGRPHRPGPRRRGRHGAVASSPRGRACASSSRRPPTRLRYCVEKGSITVDGVSLTIAELHEDAFGVALIPHTLAETTLGHARAGPAGQPRGGRPGEVRRTPASAALAAAVGRARSPGYDARGEHRGAEHPSSRPSRRRSRRSARAASSSSSTTRIARTRATSRSRRSSSRPRRSTSWRPTAAA